MNNQMYIDNADRCERAAQEALARGDRAMMRDLHRRSSELRRYVESMRDKQMETAQ